MIKCNQKNSKRCIKDLIKSSDLQLLIFIMLIIIIIIIIIIVIIIIISIIILLFELNIKP